MWPVRPAPPHAKINTMGKQKVVIEIELGARPSVAEMEVVDILVLNNIPKNHVTFLKPGRVKGTKTPDLLIDDMRWEIKSIEKVGKYTLDHALRSGLKQADNLVVDLRKLNETLENKVLTKLEKEFHLTKGWHGLIVVVRFNGRCLTFKK